MIGRQRKNTFHCRLVHPNALPSLSRFIGIEEQANLVQAVIKAEELSYKETSEKNIDLNID